MGDAKIFHFIKSADDAQLGGAICVEVPMNAAMTNQMTRINGHDNSKASRPSVPKQYSERDRGEWGGVSYLFFFLKNLKGMRRKAHFLKKKTDTEKMHRGKVKDFLFLLN